jgi:tetratricopeptide (TPR) repeat protein
VILRSIAFAVVVALVSSLSTTPAKADATRARAHYERGTSLFQVGEYRQALDEFKQAHIEKADPAFLYNIAQCHRLLGESKEALTFYRRYLSLAPDTALRPEVEKRIHELESAPATSDAPTAPPLPSPVATSPQTSPPRVSAAQLSEVSQPLPPPAPSMIETRSDRSATGRPLYSRWWVWAIVGAGVAVVATALILRNDTGTSDCLGISPCGSVH